MRAWFGTVAGKIISGGILIAIIILFFKGQSIWDGIQARLYNQKTVSSQAHGDTAKVAEKVADSTHKQGVLITTNWEGLIRSQAVRNNPKAKEVADSGTKVIDNAKAENVALRAANTQLHKQVTDLENRPDKPVPRLIPYVQPLYSFSNNRRPLLIGRAGIDYRVANHFKATLELAYQPPLAPTPTNPKQIPEIQVNVGGRIEFR